MTITDQLTRFLAPLRNAIRMMIARSIISTVNDNARVQQLCVSLLSDEMKDKIESWQNYGFTSVPLAGMEAGVAFIGGDRNNAIVFAVADRKYRLKGLQNGEVAIYTDEGDAIHLKRNNTIAIKTLHYEVNADADVTINTANFVLNAAHAEINAETDVAITTQAMLTDTTNYDLTATAAVNMQAATATVTAPTTIAGLLVPAMGMAGPAGAAVVATGDIEIVGTSTATDHISAGKSGAMHIHTAPDGGGTTTPPL